MNELIKINYDSDNPTVSGRELHEKLGIKTAYKDWFPRMCEYGFTENEDFILVAQKRATNNPKNPYTEITDHVLTIDMAKEICMLQRNEKGKMFRQYFIAVENQWNTPEAVMSRALKMAEQTIQNLSANLSQLTVENKLMQPKAEYFDNLCDKNVLTNIRETAKQLKVKERAFVSFLLSKKYVYRDKRGKLMPYAQHADNGLFELKECFNDKSGWGGTQMLITPKGRETFLAMHM